MYPKIFFKPYRTSACSNMYKPKYLLLCNRPIRDPVPRLLVARTCCLYRLATWGGAKYLAFDDCLRCGYISEIPLKVIQCQIIIFNWVFLERQKQSSYYQVSEGLKYEGRWLVYL